MKCGDVRTTDKICQEQQWLVNSVKTLINKPPVSSDAQLAGVRQIDLVFSLLSAIVNMYLRAWSQQVPLSNGYDLLHLG